MRWKFLWVVSLVSVACLPRSVVHGASADGALFAPPGDTVLGQVEVEVDEADAAVDSPTYVCPMHPAVVGEEGDRCDRCGMLLQPVEDSADPHAH